MLNTVLQAEYNLNRTDRHGSWLLDTDTPRRACVLSCSSHVQLFATLGTVARQAPLSMGFSRQEYWSGLPYPPPRNLPNPGIEPSSLMSPALAGGFFTTRATWEAPTLITCMYVCFTIEENQPWCLLLSPLFRGCRYNWLISLSTTHSGKAQFT